MSSSAGMNVLHARCLSSGLYVRPKQQKAVHQKSVVCKGQAGAPGESNDDEPPKTAINVLEQTLRRKKKELEAKFMEMGLEAMDERLSSASSFPANPPYRLTTLIAETVPQGRAVLVYEVFRTSPSATSTDVAKLAKQCVAAGADAISVHIDSYHTPEGLKDLFAVTQAVRVPVIARDWYIHPLQIAEAKEAGAAGVIGVVQQITGKGTSLMSSFSAALGLDAPVEVVNLKEVEALAKAGVVFYGINLGVGLSVAIPGFASDLAHGMLGNMPFGTITMVGVRSVEEARKARLSGADCLLVKKELVNQHTDSIMALADTLSYIVSGDD